MYHISQVHLLCYLITWLPMNSNNQALLDSFEDYMDELVENFEDFAKKSLVLIVAALGTIVFMAMYFLRHVGTENHSNRTDQEKSVPNINTSKRTIKDTGSSAKSIESYEKSTCSGNRSKDNCTASSSAEEKLIKDIRLSTSSKTFPSYHKNNVTHVKVDSRCLSPKPSRKSVQPSSNMSEVSTKLYESQSIVTDGKYNFPQPQLCSRRVAIRHSCCSMCCFDDDRR